jgi:hypothetical protein
VQFPELITSIEQSDLVLEIGPGALPHPRADVFLELRFSNEEEEKSQRGNVDKPVYNKPVVYYDGGSLPFKDQEFDYIICSHVLEHVQNVDGFLSELFRVGKRGYLEYPTVYYEYLYNFSVHVNLLKFHDNRLRYMKKSATHLDSLLPVQKFFYRSLEQEYFTLVNELKMFMFQGFEWLKPFNVEKADSLEDIVWEKPEIPKKIVEMLVEKPKGISNKIKRFFSNS